MRPIQHVVPEALAAIIRRAPLTAEKVSFAWRTAVGPAMDKATTIELRTPVLHVRARDDAWRREVERSAGIVRARIESLLGPGVVASIEVGLDPQAPAAR